MASWAYIHWGCPDFMGADMLPLAESESPKPITHAKSEWEIFKALFVLFVTFVVKIIFLRSRRERI